MAEDTPETGPVTDDASAVAHVASLLSEPEEGPPEETSEEKPQEDPPVEAEPSSKESEDAKPEEAADEGLPDTIAGLAQALEVDPGDLLGHLKMEVKVNGKVSQVTLTEAVRGYQRQADYDEKKAEFAEQRRQHDTEKQQITQHWQQQLQRLDETIQGLEAQESIGPEQMAQLMEDDPQEYLRVQARQQAQRERLEKAKRTRDDELQRTQQESYQRMATFRTEQQRLLKEKLPHVSDPVKLRIFEDKAAAYLRSKGFTDDEINGFFNGPFDHRQVLIIDDAWQLQAMKDGKKELPKKLQGLAKVQKPGASQPKSTVTDRLSASSQKLRQLKKKGTKSQQTDAAVEHVKKMLG